MAGAYSQDLREKALAALASGQKIKAVSEMFDVHRDTLRRWKKQQSETGSCAAKQGHQQGHSRKITDWEAFRVFAERYGERTQAEVAAL